MAIGRMRHSVRSMLLSKVFEGTRNFRGPAPSAATLSPGPSEFADGAGYYVIDSTGHPSKIDTRAGPYRFPAGGAMIVEIGGLPAPLPAPDPARPSEMIFAPPVEPSAKSGVQPPPAYRLADTGRWLPLEEGYDSPIYLPPGTEVSIPAGWGRGLDPKTRGGLVLYPGGASGARTRGPLPERGAYG